MQGYEGVAYFQIGGVNRPFLCTGGGLTPVTRKKIDSGGAFGGTPESPLSTLGVGAPHTYDWSDQTGTLNFDMNYGLLAYVIKPWVYTSREASFLVTTVPRLGSWTTAYCHWTGINVSASEGALVSAGIDLYAEEITSSEYETDRYIYNKTGVINPSELISSGMIPSLNPNAGTGLRNEEPYPYWNTRIEFDNAQRKSITNWSVSFSQDVVPFYGCNNNAQAQRPLYLGVGPMSVTFSCDLLLMGEPSGLTPVTDISKIGVFFGPPQLVVDWYRSLIFNKPEIQKVTHEIQTGSGMVPVSVEYQIYELSDS